MQDKDSLPRNIDQHKLLIFQKIREYANECISLGKMQEVFADAERKRHPLSIDQLNYMTRSVGKMEEEIMRLIEMLDLKEEATE